MTADNTGWGKCPDCGQDDCVFHLAYLAQRDDIILPLRPNRRYVVQGKIVAPN